MSRAKREVAVERPGFWRCAACGTPNPDASYLTRCLGCGGDRRALAVVARPRVAVRSVEARGLLAASWTYAMVVIAVLILIRWVGISWWVVAPLLMMPRWLFLLPVGLLAAVSGLRRYPWHWAVQGATALVVAGPLMGLSLPLARLLEFTPPAGRRVRVVTFNLGLGRLPAEELRAWLAREEVDVVCFQEGTRGGDATRQLLGEGWNASEQGGVASRWPIVWQMPRYEETVGGDERWTGKLDLVRLRAPDGAEFAVASVHMPTLRYALERFAQRDTAGGRLHLEWWANEMSRMLGTLARSNDLPLILAGDFNAPADDTTMASLHAHFRFAFSDAGWGYGYTRPTKYPWVRIDHILAGPEWAVTDCRVGPDLGSDHLPLFAEVVLAHPAAPSGNPPAP